MKLPFIPLLTRAQQENDSAKATSISALLTENVCGVKDESVAMEGLNKMLLSEGENDNGLVCDPVEKYSKNGKGISYGVEVDK